MSESQSELRRIAEALELLAQKSQNEDIEIPLGRLRQAADEVGKAWSGSWIGYHANVYYRDFQPAPPGVHFSQEWGSRKSKVWVEFDPECVEKVILERAGMPDMNPARNFNEVASDEFRSQKSNLISILEVELSDSESLFFSQTREQLEDLAIQSRQDFVRHWMPKRIRSRDQLALDQGWWTPPHFSVLSEVEAIQHSAFIVRRLAELTRQSESHIRRQRRIGEAIGTRVFIGHGHSLVWRELKDFIEERLSLSVDEFNRVSTAGMSITDRLSEMMDNAAFAFLVLTGEDERPSGRLQARMNVIHEAGLFQGKLGFKRAIVLLEDGCEEFSNIHGLVHIPFPEGHINSTFEDIRRVLEREGVLRTDG